MPSIEWNRRTWGRDHQWDEGGDEWSNMAAHCGAPYADWKQAVLEAFLLPYVGADRDALEIAPGHGRWSETLVERCRSVVLVDINPECIDACRERFAAESTVAYELNDGTALAGADGSVDVVWSFDSFVHMDPDVIDAYLREIARVLRPGGYAVLHHADKLALGLALAPKAAGYGRAGKLLTQVASQGRVRDSGNRSDVSAAMVAGMARSAGLHVAQQTDRWGPGGKYTVAKYHDAITVLRAPDSPAGA